MSRILHVISTPEGIGGAERVLLALVAAGKERGWDQLVLNPFERQGGGSDLGQVLKDVYQYESADSLRDLWRIRRWLDRSIVSFDPQIVQAHLFHALVAVGSLRRSPQRLTLLNHQHGDRKRSEGQRLHAFLDKRFGKRFDHVVACSEAVRRFLVRDYGYDSAGVTTIHNGWSGTPLPRSPEGPFTVVCVANMKPAKGHEVLLRAFAALSDAVTGARLLLVGDGPLRTRLTEQVDTLGIANAVEFAGPVDDVWPYLAKAHVAALPSYNEPFGIAALEAMGATLPVVATNVGGLPEFVDDGLTGRLVPSGDVVALCEALRWTHSNPSEADAMGRAGADKAASMTMRDMANRYFSLYAELLDANAGVAR